MILHDQSDSFSVAEQSPSWIDISVPLQSSLVHWPGDPPFSVKHQYDDMGKQRLTTSAISMGSHTGTHIDAPSHCFDAGSSIEKMPFDTTVGRARVIQIDNTEVIEPEHLADKHIRQGQRILLKTQNSLRHWQSEKFTDTYCHISIRTAQLLVEKRIRAIGIDYLSIGGNLAEGHQTHCILLKGGVWIVEGLNLSAVQPGIYHLNCLPLKIIGGDGAPARAILKPINK